MEMKGSKLLEKPHQFYPPTLYSLSIHRVHMRTSPPASMGYIEQSTESSLVVRIKTEQRKARQSCVDRGRERMCAKEFRENQDQI